MAISPRGKVDLHDEYHAELSRVTAHGLTVSYVPGLTVSLVPSCSRTGTYDWQFTNHRHASDRLKLTNIHDACKPRVGLFAGVWLTAYPLR